MSRNDWIIIRIDGNVLTGKKKSPRVQTEGRYITMKTMKQTDSKANSARKQTTSHSARKHIDNLTQSGHVITILDDYSSSATGEYITLDFSNIAACFLSSTFP